MRPASPDDTQVEMTEGPRGAKDRLRSDAEGTGLQEQKPPRLKEVGGELRRGGWTEGCPAPAPAVHWPLLRLTGRTSLQTLT